MGTKARLTGSPQTLPTEFTLYPHARDSLLQTRPHAAPPGSCDASGQGLCHISLQSQRPGMGCGHLLHTAATGILDLYFQITVTAICCLPQGNQYLSLNQIHSSVIYLKAVDS